MARDRPPLARPTGARIIAANRKARTGGFHDGGARRLLARARRRGVAADSRWPPRRAAAQSYPSGPVRVLVPFGAGGATDILARVFAERLQQSIGQSFTVENRGGAAGQIAAAAFARAPADGYTLMFTTAAPITIAPLMNDKVQYDPRKDFVPVAVVAVQPVWLVVNADSPLKSRPTSCRRPRKPRQAQLRHVRRRHRAASRGRSGGALGRHPDGARAVSRRRRGHHRAARPADRFRGAQHRVDRRRAEAGHAARAGGVIAEAHDGLSRRADLRRARPCRRHHGAMVGHDGAGRHAAAVVARLTQELEATTKDDAVRERLKATFVQIEFAGPQDSPGASMPRPSSTATSSARPTSSLEQ